MSTLFDQCGPASPPLLQEGDCFLSLEFLSYRERHEICPRLLSRCVNLPSLQGHHYLPMFWQEHPSASPGPRAALSTCVQHSRELISLRTLCCSSLSVPVSPLNQILPPTSQSNSSKTEKLLLTCTPEFPSSNSLRAAFNLTGTSSPLAPHHSHGVWNTLEILGKYVWLFLPLLGRRGILYISTNLLFPGKFGGYGRGARKWMERRVEERGKKRDKELC